MFFFDQLAAKPKNVWLIFGCSKWRGGEKVGGSGVRSPAWATDGRIMRCVRII